MADEQSQVCASCGTPLSLSSGAPGCLQCMLIGGLDQADERRFQHYEIELSPNGHALRELGRGAMGITYRAIDLNLGALVALKVISARCSNQPEARARFREEAQIAARLRHPNVASVFHFGESPGGDCFYAMELVDGETLEARVRREASLGAAVVLEIASQVARALLAAEKHGLVHRDLKPSNLMLLPNEHDDSPGLTVKVIDFGLARIIGAPGGLEQAEQSRFSGTPGFASPEQMSPGLRALDGRSDIYSLGATLHYALTGRLLPEMGEGMQLDHLRLNKIPKPLIALLRSMLARDPADRPQSARELLQAIEKCRRQLAVTGRRRWLAATAAVLALGVIAFGFGRTKYLSKLSPNDSKQIPPGSSVAEPSTEGVSAYELFKEARAIDVWEDAHGAEKSLIRKIALLRLTTQREPTFALAFCLLAKTECDFAQVRDADVHLPLAKNAAEMAMRLQPNSGEAYRELARYYLHVADFKRARSELERARQLLPNDSEFFFVAAYVDEGERD